MNDLSKTKREHRLKHIERVREKSSKLFIKLGYQATSMGQGEEDECHGSVLPQAAGWWVGIVPATWSIMDSVW